MSPPPAIRCEVSPSRGEANVYHLCCRLGPEPTEADLSEAGEQLQQRLAAELHRRADYLSAPPSAVAWLLGKGWSVHLYAVGQWPAQEQ
jgi:hypothetical protein